MCRPIQKNVLYYNFFVYCTLLERKSEVKSHVTFYEWGNLIIMKKEEKGKS